jgi:pilus assembly protein CpaC
MTRNSDVFLTACLIAALQTAGQTLPTRQLSVVAGRGELLSFSRDVNKVVVSEPKIADAVVVSPTEVMVNGKAAGNTTLVVWESGSAPVRWDVHVRHDEAEWDRFHTELRSVVPDSSVQASASGDTIVLSGSVKTAEDSKRLGALASTRYKNVVNLLQTPAPGDPRQILLQVKFASVDRLALSELGFNLFSTNPTMLGATSTQQFQGPRFGQFQQREGELNNSNLNFADLLNLFVFRPDLNIGATVRALQGRNLLQILAEPNLIAIEGSEASFLAGGQFPFPTLQATTTGGAIAPVVTVQFKPFGVRLDFKPTILPSGAIHLRVKPEVSSLDYANAVTLQGFLIPAVSTRTAETEVVLRDGESFAIAGLIDNRVIEVLNRIKGLGDIPILGYLFRSRSTKKSTDELLVVVTPRFVRPLTADQKVQLPETMEAFLPTVGEEKAKDKKNTKPPQPEFVGPRGHQVPK